MNKILLTAFFCLSILVLSTSCGSKNKADDNSKSAEQVADNKAKAKDKYIKLAEKINSKMPQVYPGGLRADRVEAVSDKEFKYILTFTSEPAVSADEFVRSAKLPLAMGIRDAKEEFQSLKKDKMTIVYAYYKKDGSLFAEIRISPEEYAK